MESMRSVGYTLESALADLIDNSISANSSEVRILFATVPDDYVAILDNGRGMGAPEARAAMQLAGRSPLDGRDADDLGRFGLGLKTASFSQCRDLVVVTLGPDGLVGLRWDLDHLLETRRWTLQVLSTNEIHELPVVERLVASGRGTLVLWRKLDALRAQVGNDVGLDAAMVRTRDHLQLVFHRFLAGEHGRTLSLSLNEVPLEVVDPFLQSNRRTVAGPEESFRVGGEIVRIRPFTLPHLNNLTARDRERAIIAGSLRDSQGFYVYRAMRLVIWGTWFRILPREDVAKLARVRVDIPNTLDHLWALDIKKSAAQPPPEVKSRLRRFADKMVVPSKRVYSYRGRRPDDPVQRIWALVEDRDHFRYEINRSHPVVALVGETLDIEAQQALARLLTLIERSYPVDDAFHRIAEDRSAEPPPKDEGEDRELARQLWLAFRKATPDPEAFVKAMSAIEPFANLSNGEGILRKAAL
jgi:hypothetical protein